MVDWTELERLYEAFACTYHPITEDNPEYDRLCGALARSFPAILAERKAMLAKLEAAAIPPGYKLVPVEPTEAMIRAYLDAQANYCFEQDKRGDVISPKLACAAGVKAMLAAILPTY